MATTVTAPPAGKTWFVLGFGGRAPESVLELLTASSEEQVIVQQSPTIQRKLLAHGKFAVADADIDSFWTSSSFDSSTMILLYCLPSSPADYVMNYSSQVVKIQEHVYKQSPGVVSAKQVWMYDAVKNGLVLNDSTVMLTALASLNSLAISSLGTKTVLVIGSGGREHAIAVALAKSVLVKQVLVCPGNGGTCTDETNKIINVGTSQSNESVLQIVEQYVPNMVVVGPEQPLVDGLVDFLAERCPSVKVFGPTQAAAQLEASKAFTKDFLQENNIPTAKYRNFTDVSEALQYVESLSPDDRQVVKASGLAAGKGVLLPTTKQETLAAVIEIMADRAFGAAGDTCVIESYLSGPEASCLAFCDGKTAVLMPAAQDHKRALDHDQGLNTGGMGAYAPAPCVTPDLQTEIAAMCQRTVEKMAERNTPYVGILYAGIILTPTGPQVLEFNCRFGDPETQALLPLLESDLYEVLEACCDGTLHQVDVRFRQGASAVTVVCASMGYPQAYPKGMRIVGLDQTSTAIKHGVKIYHAGTKLDEEGMIRCNGGRVLAVTGMGSNLQLATRLAYQGVKTIDFVQDKDSSVSLMHYRTDIAQRALQKKLRIGVLGSTRGTALIPVIKACEEESIPAEIVAVVSNRSAAPILDKGRAMGVTTRFFSAKGLSRQQYDAKCTSVFVEAGVDLVILVGYMRILSKQFCEFWASRCINVHPSLLPKFAGGMDLEVHQAVIEAMEIESGCTIHYVTEDVDGGPIIVQRRVPVSVDDTPESLKVKVQVEEGQAFIDAILKLSGGNVTTYADAGVDIDAGNALVDLIKPACKSTRRLGCDADLGGFGGLFDLAAAGYSGPDTVLIGATDGVGTKLKIAQQVNKHDWVGIDLVAMCVNDLIVAGGEPLFFLDYFATGKLNVEQAARVVQGIAEGCRQAGCGLIGGETAEMPSMYSPGEYDLAGFAVGAVRRDAILPRDVVVGDVLIGLASTGIHSNGFSLVRRLIDKEGMSFMDPCPWDDSETSIGDALLKPTKIYVESCLPLIRRGLVKGMAHITGGGILENLPRSLPKGLGARINHPPLPNVFRWLQMVSGLDDSEMLRTFNCGIGMVLIVAPSSAEEVMSTLATTNAAVALDLGVVSHGEGVVVVGPLR